MAPDVNSTTVGVTGSNADVTYEKIAFPIIDRFGNIHHSAFRITNNNLGVEPRTPIPFVTEACKQLGIKQEVRHLFNFLKKPCKIRILLGLNNIFTFPKLIDPREFAGTYPVASPHLKVFRTNLSDLLLVVGSIGINPELFSDVTPVFMLPKVNPIPKTHIWRPSATDESSKNPFYTLFENLPGDTNYMHTYTMQRQTIDDITKRRVNPFAGIKINVNEPKTVMSHKKKGLHDDDIKTVTGWSKNPMTKPEGNNKPGPSQPHHTPKDEFSPEKDDGTGSLTSTPNKLSIQIICPTSTPSNDGQFQTKILLCKEDHMALSKFIENENHSFLNIKRKCQLHSSPCEECKFINRFNSQEQENIILKTYDLQTAIPQPNGTYKIKQSTVWRNDPHVTFAPDRSNLRSAAAAAKSFLSRLKKKDPNLIKCIDDQIQQNIALGFMHALSPKEVDNLKNETHSFCHYNIVWNESSTSTPVRLVCNSSTVVPRASTTISIEQQRPDKPLNSMFNALMRLRLYSVPLISDISKAYKHILIDKLASKCRLLYYYKDPMSCTNPQILVRSTLDFGDALAPFALEVANLKYIANHVDSKVAKYIVEDLRYADNIVFSFKTVDEYEHVKKELQESYSHYNLPLKYLVTSQRWDPNVLQSKDRGSDPKENLFGLVLDLSTDELIPNLTLSLFAKSRGKSQGEPLKETHIKMEHITRTSLSRITAQLYDVCGVFIQPYIFQAKVFLSRACTIASLDQINEPLENLDKDFAAEAYKFIMSLKKVWKINPLPREIVPSGNTLIGFVASRDGGVPGFGTLIHALHSKDSRNLETSLVAAKSRIARRSVFVHELLSISLSLDLILQVLDSLEFDHSDHKFEIISIGDSASVAALFNIGLTIKSILARSQVELIKNAMISIGVKFPNSKIRLCWMSGVDNPADTVSKLFPDALSICNSTLYRHGPEMYKSIADITKYTYLTYENEEFKYEPLPETIVGKCNKESTSDTSGPESKIVEPDNIFKVNLSKQIPLSIALLIKLATVSK